MTIPLNRKVSAREVRRRLNAEMTTLAELIPAVNQLIHNDAITQAKVTTLEAKVATLEQRHAAEDAWTVWQRLRWLFQGVRS